MKVRVTTKGSVTFDAAGLAALASARDADRKAGRSPRAFRLIGR
jgi:hypothetical protein